MENTGDQWHRALSKRIGKAIAARRKELGMTAQQLAARCSELDAPIHRTTITKIENGRSRFDLGELIVLAAALNTSPVVLVYPGPYQNKIEILPGRESEEFNAAQWFSGLQRVWPPAAAADDDLGPITEWDDAVEELETYRLLAERNSARSRALADIARNPDGPTVSLLWDQVAMYDKMIHELKEQLGIGGDDA